MANIPWKDGKGNVVKEVADACRKHGLSMGVYIYPDEPRFARNFGRGGVTDDPKKQEEWNRLFRKQWEEVLTICGPDLVREVWFDGGCKIPVQDIFDQLAPNAVIFQGSHATLRWVGNKRGIADNPNWNSLKLAALKTGVAVSGGCWWTAPGEYTLTVEGNITRNDKSVPFSAPLVTLKASEPK
ncbi:MAG: alpha-L-fucosidase [Kiritimatiellaeota bacterium]|nr:alpha-L-fucosidase [Kiritimatiellota bacterium]